MQHRALERGCSQLAPGSVGIWLLSIQRGWSSSSLELHPCPNAASFPGALSGAGAVVTFGIEGGHMGICRGAEHPDCAPELGCRV